MWYIITLLQHNVDKKSENDLGPTVGSQQHPTPNSFPCVKLFFISVWMDVKAFLIIAYINENLKEGKLMDKSFLVVFKDHEKKKHFDMSLT